jgi:RimJ/RimL family protein N-acetyltransferase
MPLPLGPSDWRTVIEADRLLLVPLSRADADDLFPVLDDHSLHLHIGGEPMDAAALKARYERLERGGPDDESEVWANWIVRLRETREAVGYVQATIGEHGANLAWVIGRAWQRQGYASETTCAMTAWLRGAGVVTLRAHIHLRNVSSGRVAERAGLRPTGETDADGEAVWESCATRPRSA